MYKKVSFTYQVEKFFSLQIRLITILCFLLLLSSTDAKGLINMKVQIQKLKFCQNNTCIYFGTSVTKGLFSHSYMVNDNLSTLFFNMDKFGVLKGVNFFVENENLTMDDVMYFSEIVSEISGSIVSINKIHSCLYETKRGTQRYLQVGPYTLKCYPVGLAPYTHIFVY